MHSITIIKSFLRSGFTVLSILFFASPAFADVWATGEYALTELLTPRESTPVHLTYNKVSTSEYGYLSYNTNNASLRASLRFKSVCPAGFGISSVWVHAEDYETVQKIYTGDTRGWTYTVNDIKIANFTELQSACLNLGRNGKVNFPRSLTAKIQCTEGDPGIGATEIKHYSHDLRFDSKILCIDVLPPPASGVAYATVTEGHWQYTCPNSYQDTDEFWNTYRLVVEGTYSTQVRTIEPIGSPRCIRRYKSDGSNESKVIWRNEHSSD